MSLLANPFIWAIITASVYITVCARSKNISLIHIIPGLLFLIPAYLFTAHSEWIFFVSYLFFCIAVISIGGMGSPNAVADFFSGILFAFPLIISLILFAIFFIWGVIHHYTSEKEQNGKATSYLNVNIRHAGWFCEFGLGETPRGPRRCIIFGGVGRAKSKRSAPIEEAPSQWGRSTRLPKTREGPADLRSARQVSEANQPGGIDLAKSQLVQIHKT